MQSAPHTGKLCFVKVHDYVKYDIGDSKFITSEANDVTNPLPDLAVKNETFISLLRAWINERLSESGTAYTTSKAYFMLLNDKTHAISSLTLPASKAMPSHLGDMYKINLTNMLPADYTGNCDHISENAILVNTSWDIEAGVVQCLFFHLPQSLESL